MKHTTIIFTILISLFMTTMCSAQSNKNKATTSISKTENVEVFYFHYTRRCATCNAVESVSKEAIAELYGNKVGFSGFNLDEETGIEKGKELEVSGQTLLIVAGETQINITNEGFMYARSNPEKLKAIIREKIDPLL